MACMRFAKRSHLVAVLFLAACVEGASGSSGAGEASIDLRVTGGLAGVDYAIFVDGTAGTIVGGSCSAGCDFESGQILRVLSAEQVSHLTNLFLAAGVHALDGRDFGIRCCDQFHYDLTFEDAGGSSSVRGSSEALPADLRHAIGELLALVSGSARTAVIRPIEWEFPPTTGGTTVIQSGGGTLIQSGGGTLIQSGGTVSSRTSSSSVETLRSLR